MNPNSIVWTIEEAYELIRRIQPDLKPLGFHVALAGGVLNLGYSAKDLDLVFLPLTNDKAPAIFPLLTYLNIVLGFANTYEDSGMSHDPNPYSPYRDQWQYPFGGKRIDVFIA